MKRIMVADDSGTSRMIIQCCFSMAGCRDAEFLQVADGEEALKTLKAEDVDMIVTDINMPNMTGEELLRSIRAENRWGSIPVVIISSKMTPEKEKDMLALGATATLNKPISPVGIMGLLRQLGWTSGNA